MLRKKYCLNTGTRVILQEENDGFEIIRAVTAEEINENIGVFEMEKELNEGAKKGNKAGK